MHNGSVKNVFFQIIEDKFKLLVKEINRDRNLYYYHTNATRANDEIRLLVLEKKLSESLVVFSAREDSALNYIKNMEK